MNDYINIERKFRPEIEGLRFIAALLVGVYHIWFGRVSGGVDVFFVVSGFLITTSIISKINKERRLNFFTYIGGLIKRLYPSIIVVLSTVSILSIFLLPQTIADKTLKEIIASLFYYQNWQLAFSNTDYLDQQQMKTPVEHFWAMSIQGQFYIIWFLLFAFIIFIVRRNSTVNGKALVNILLGFLFVLSLSYSIYLTSVNQPWAYFDVTTRVWEFALGGLLAVNLSSIRVNSLTSVIIGWAGLVGLLLTGVIFDVSTLFPGYVALWPVLCATFILIAGNHAPTLGVQKLLGTKLMMQLGSISFGFYLWHWVILSFYQYHFEGRPDIYIGTGIILLSWILSWLMTDLIEKPIRNSNYNNNAWRRLGVGFIANIFIISIFLVTIQSQASGNIDMDGVNHEYPGATAILNDFSVEEKEPLPGLSEVKDDLAVLYEDELVTFRTEGHLKLGEYGKLEDYDKTIILVGSSHSAHWMGALKGFAEDKNIRILTLIQTGSRFSTDNEEEPKKEWNENAIDYLHENKSDIDLVVATADVGYAAYSEPPTGMAEQLNRVADEVGLPVLAIRDNQRFAFNIPEHYEKYGYESTKKKMNQVEEIPETPLWEHVDYKSDDLHTVDYSEYFKIDGEYEPIIGNVFVYIDNSHISNSYSKTMSPIVESDVARLLDMYE